VGLHHPPHPRDTAGADDRRAGGVLDPAFAPGDPAALIAGDQATPDQITAIRAKLGLDLPVHQQFLLWIGNVLQGDLGTSIFSNRPVALLFMQRLEPTVALAILTTIIAVVLAVPIGVLAAWKAGPAIDRGVMSSRCWDSRFRCFVIGYVLIYIFDQAEAAADPGLSAAGRRPVAVPAPSYPAELRARRASWR
jgi:ABC-type dipeptide/oligopeptide/nickel transport system permease component